VLAANQNIVVVTINYRLGALGFFASEELSKEAPNKGSTGGMNGILDMIAALDWVKENAHHYGGDASKVTIAGESAGAEAVCNLLVSPVAAGKFESAIIESGPCLFGSFGWGPHPSDEMLANSASLAKVGGGQAPSAVIVGGGKAPSAVIVGGG
jgi:para-nitrobenzyl esterase